MISRRFITEASDSKLVSADTYGKRGAQIHFLNLRLNVLIRILFNDQVVIPQGWSIDSFTFLKVANEIVTAMETIRNSTKPPDEFHRFSPLVMERHVDTISYLDTLKWYLRRNDCHWSGIPILRRHPERRARILASLESDSPSHTSDLSTLQPPRE